MALRPLLVGPELREQINALVRHAEAHPFDQTHREADVTERPDNMDEIARPFTMQIPVGYQVTFTIEIQKAGRFRHISVSVETPGGLPSQEAVEAVAELFGMGKIDFDSVQTWSDLTFWLEDFAPGHQAVNVVQLIEPPVAH